MASSLVLTITSEETEARTVQRLALNTNDTRASILSVANLVGMIAKRHIRGDVLVQTAAAAPVAASGTATLVSCATDTITIGGVTFTGSSTPSGDEQFETDGNDAADAAALAAKITAHPTLGKIVVATSNSNVVTITCRVPGLVGNFITLSETGTTITVSGAALAGGTGGVEDSGTVLDAGI